ncbi:unnamed protein product [Peniophora sp. CBMAI 1063]|nr:unnamed protein product [Peniophora sp. CBMAI 1063]
MPLDSQTYLRNNGWKGHGTALREGALSRPLSIPQKRTLAGVGKDRDEAFPFWDHVFAAASSAIQIKVGSDDESDSESTPAPSLRRTTTGIISNKRPPTGTIVDHSSSTTPEPTSHPQSVMAIAKRAAARKNLYSRFFKGPVLGPDATEKEMVQTEKMSMEEKVHAGHEDMRDALEHAHIVHHTGEEAKSGDGKNKRKRDEVDREVKEEGKTKRSREEKEQRRAEKAKRKAEKEARRAAKASVSTTAVSSASASTSKSASVEPEPLATEDDAKAVKRRAKEERRKARTEPDGGVDPEAGAKAKRRAEREERKAKKLAKEVEKSTSGDSDKPTKKATPTVLEPEGEPSLERKKKRRREAVEDSTAMPVDGPPEKEGKKKKRRRESSA